MSVSRVYVVDDDADLCDAVARSLCRAGFDARPTSSATDLLSFYCDAPAACVICDISMPDMDGFELAERVRELDLATALVFMTAWPSTSGAVDAVRRYGGLDYLEKPIDEDRLLESVTEAVDWSRRRRAAWEKIASLTSRERDVFLLLAKGYSNKAVANELVISPKTVEDHRAAVMAKTGATCVAHLISLAAELS